MKYVLLATAALLAAVPVTSAQAQSSASAAFVGVNSGGKSVRVHRFGGDRRDGWHRRDRHDRHDRRDRFDDGVVFGDWYGGEWALYNNRTFEPDSYNDWWHDRPDRAFPRWVQAGNCERMWWSGGGWRC